ncbi:MAG: WG repeat-containing protein [Oscillospiraceae bacterium]|jgi:hypothetical protein|nr:WG repeat-containing protein [Oscillospiraceae bacterium]
MRGYRRPAAALTGLALCAALAGCGVAPPAPTSAPSPTAVSDEGFALREIYGRWYEETTLEVLPRADYGAIYPYLGGVVPREWPAARNVTLYGFATADGRIICDPAFSDVAAYETDGGLVYAARRDTAHVTAEGSAGYRTEYASEDMSYVTWLIAGDGSFATAYDEVEDAGGGYFSVRRDGLWGVVDASGAEVLARSYQYPPYYGEGLFVVTPAGAPGENASLLYYYVDMDGERVIGEAAVFLSANMDVYGVEPARLFLRQLVFSRGRAVSYGADGSYGYIDTSGALVIPRDYVTFYDYAEPFYADGRVVARIYTEGGVSENALIGTDGREIIPRGAYLIFPTKDLYCVSEYPARRYVDADGREVASYPETGGSGYLGDGWFAVENTVNGERVLEISEDGAVRFTVPESADYGLPTVTRLEDGTFVSLLGTYNSASLRVLDASGAELYSFTRDAQLETITPDGLLRFSKSEPTAGGGGYAYYAGITAPDGTETLPVAYLYLTRFGAYYTGQRGYYGGLLDANGDWVVKVSLLDGMDD